MTADRVALIDWDEAHVDVPDLDLVLPHNAAGLDDDAHDIAAQASAAWEAAVCWDDEYAVKRLAEVRAVLAYVLDWPGLLRGCWPQRSPTGAAGQPAADRWSQEAPLPCSTTTPEASRELAARCGPARPSGAGHQRRAGASGRAGPQLHPRPAYYGYVYPVAQRWRETGPSAGSLPAGSPSTRSTPEPGIQTGRSEQPAQRARARR